VAEAALTVASLCLCHFLLFCLIELFPSLIPRLHLDGISYYAIKECCVGDDKLVFRETSPSGSSDYRGDRFSPLYNVDLPVIHMEWTTDKNGFRFNVPADSSDLVILGDSYIAFAENEADPFGRRLQRLSGLTIQNLGVGGYGPYQYLEVFKRYGVAQKPKRALFCFYEGNDIRDMRSYLVWKQTGKYNGRYFHQPFWGRYLTAVTDEISYLQSAFWMQVQLAENKFYSEKIHPDVADVNIGHKNYPMLFYHRADTRPPDEIERSKELQQLKAILAEFRDISAQHGIQPMIMFIPSMVHIYAEHSTEQSGRNWLKVRSEQIADKANMEIAVSRVANELQIPLTSLSPAFEAAARDGKLLYYPFDAHWNSTGREVAAEFVAEVLKSERD
jgi:hypothetical protein